MHAPDLSAPVPIVTRMVSLSPSRIADFKTCPLLYRFRAIDRLPEPPSADAARGTLVHAVLERIFDSAAPDRTPAQAHLLATSEWERMVADDDELAVLIGEDSAEQEAWLDGTRRLLDTYFTLEDPARLEPAERELLVEIAPVSYTHLTLPTTIGWCSWRGGPGG